MQNSTTILGIIEMRLKGISYDDCRNCEFQSRSHMCPEI